MDGGFHYSKSNNVICENDIVKDNLAAEHNVTIIRIDCNYDKIGNRFFKKPYHEDGIVEVKQVVKTIKVLDWEEVK